MFYISIVLSIFLLIFLQRTIHINNQYIFIVQDSNFVTALELAVRFGKTLIIQEVDGVEPILYPVLRKDFTSQGPRFVVQIGEKGVDYNENFRCELQNHKTKNKKLYTQHSSPRKPERV